MVLGAVGTLPEIYIDLEINYFLLRRLLGVKTTDKKQAKVAKLTKGEVRQFLPPNSIWVIKVPN